MLIAGARSPAIKRAVQRSWAGSRLARRYVAGEDAASAASFAAELRERRIRASTFYLGEYVDTRDQVEENVRQKLDVSSRLADLSLDTHVSVDPTQIGLQQDHALFLTNARRIARHVARVTNGRPGVHRLMFDMEDDRCVEPTIAAHNALAAEGLPVAITLQAYLRRTEKDLADLISAGAHVRLVKGAFALRGGAAFQTHEEIKRNYRRLVELMVSRDALERNFRPAIATHDHEIQRLAMSTAARNGWSPSEYEFEMLLGVRPRLAEELAGRGATVRLYAPFGTDWWPHAARRIGESPRNAGLLLRSILQH